MFIKLPVHFFLSILKVKVMPRKLLSIGLPRGFVYLLVLQCHLRNLTFQSALTSGTWGGGRVDRNILTLTMSKVFVGMNQNSTDPELAGLASEFDFSLH